MSTIPHESSTGTLRHIASTCGRKVLLGFVLFFSVLGCVGLLIEHYALVKTVMSEGWSHLMWSVSLGGRFWGAVSVGFLAIGAFVWAACVEAQLCKKDIDQGVMAFRGIMCGGALVWLLANIAMHSLFAATPFNAYQYLAWFVMDAPYVPVVVMTFGLVGLAISRLETPPNGY